MSDDYAELRRIEIMHQHSAAAQALNQPQSHYGYVQRQQSPEERRTGHGPRTNIRVTSRHKSYLSGNLVDISSSKRPYGLTCSQISGVSARRSVGVNRPRQWGWAKTSCSISVLT